MQEIHWVSNRSGHNRSGHNLLPGGPPGVPPLHKHIRLRHISHYIYNIKYKSRYKRWEGPMRNINMAVSIMKL